MFGSMMSRNAWCTVLALSAMAAVAKADANPEYTAWAKCKVGATVKVAGTSEVMGNKTSQTITTKLLALTPDKATVETSIGIDVMGHHVDQPGNKRDILAAGKPMKTPTMPGAGAPNAKIGEETITVAGKDYKCTTTEATTDSNGAHIVAKTWTCPDVPGGLVKMESTSTGKITMTTSMELVESTDGN